MLHNIYNNPFNPKKEGDEDREMGLYGNKYWRIYARNINEFWLYDNCDKIKMYTNKNTRELGFNPIKGQTASKGDLSNTGSQPWYNIPI